MAPPQIDPQSDPRNHPQMASVPGQGGNKRYIGTGQDRQSVQDFTPEQIDAIRRLLTSQATGFNNTLEGTGVNFPNWYQPEDLDAQVSGTQPEPVPDPWSMMQPGQAGGRGPAGAGNSEFDAYGQQGSWMDRLSGHPLANPNQGTFTGNPNVKHLIAALMSLRQGQGVGAQPGAGVAQGVPQGLQQPSPQDAQRQQLTQRAIGTGMRAV